MERQHVFMYHDIHCLRLHRLRGYFGYVLWCVVSDFTAIIGGGVRVSAGARGIDHFGAPPLSSPSLH